MLPEASFRRGLLIGADAEKLDATLQFFKLTEYIIQLIFGREEMMVGNAMIFMGLCLSKV
jgi:hypothetical protein